MSRYSAAANGEKVNATEAINAADRSALFRSRQSVSADGAWSSL